MAADSTTVPGPICDFCFHENSLAQSRCARCGAPLPTELLPGVPEPEPEEPESVTAPAVEGKVLPHPGMQWRGAVNAAANKAEYGLRNPGRIIAVILGTGTGVVLLVGGIIVAAALVFVHLVPDFGLPDGGTSRAAQSWADQLRAISTCERIYVDERCVLTAGHHTLFGGLTSGRDLIFWIRPLGPDALGATVRRWRAEGGRIPCDGQTFVQVSPTAAVHYANGRAGVAVETDPFTDRSGAQVFLTRSGVQC